MNAVKRSVDENYALKTLVKWRCTLMGVADVRILAFDLLFQYLNKNFRAGKVKKVKGLSASIHKHMLKCQELLNVLLAMFQCGSSSNHYWGS